jgi:hypothetical protein
MANTSNPKGFEPQSYNDLYVIDWPIADSETVTTGDVLYIEAATGHATLARVAGKILGVAVEPIRDSITGDVNATSSATTGEDYIKVNTDPNLIMKAQISTGAATDPYTTASSATAFDIAGTTGVQYINAAASAQDEIKVLWASTENPGEPSVAGAYQKVLCRFNGLMHIFGTQA